MGVHLGPAGDHGPDDTIPEGAEAQADLCFAAIDAILAEAGFDRMDTVRINAFVTDRAHMGGYMAARDRWCAGMARLPASTLVIVAGFTRPEFKVEVEVAAARLPGSEATGFTVDAPDRLAYLPPRLWRSSSVG
jgi:enamine deaminase RidA (YjgF/YER057c/UK114 family)